MRIKIGTILLLLYFINIGCTATANQPIENTAPEVRILYRDAQCGESQPSARAVWIDNFDQLNAVFARATRNAVDQKQPGYPPVDFSQEGVLMVSMGQRPTSGYTLDLTSSKLKVSGPTAVLNISWVEPPQDAMLLQVITHPCMLLAMPKGSYDRIHLLDQEGRLRLQLNLK
jgi:hypothetical protein